MTTLYSAAPPIPLTRLFQLFVIANVVLYASYTHEFLHDTGTLPIKPLMFFAMTLALAAGVFVLRLPVLMPRLSPAMQFWVVLFVAHSLIAFLYSDRTLMAETVLIRRVEMAMLMLAFLVLFQQDPENRAMRLGFVLVVLMGTALNFYDFLEPTWSDVPGRAAGLYLNPTIAAKVLVLSMVLAAPLVPSRWRLGFCLLAGLGVMITFSRGGWILWAIGITGLAGAGLILRGRRVFALVVFGVVGAATVYGLLSGGFVGLIEGAGFGEQLTPNTLGRLGGEGSESASWSLEGRTNAASRAWHVFVTHPVFGQGLAFTREPEFGVAPHNMYLTMAAEGGLIGISMFLLLLLFMWREGDGAGRTATMVYAGSSMFSHNNLEQATMLLVVAAIVASARRPDGAGNRP